MRVLLDQNVNIRFVSILNGHDVVVAHEMDWRALTTPDLLAAAEAHRIDAIITVDKTFYQQSLTGKSISVLVLESTSITWRTIRLLEPLVWLVLQRLPKGASISVAW